jgi:hypothetical protein
VLRILATGCEKNVNAQGLFAGKLAPTGIATTTTTQKDIKRTKQSNQMELKN